ncbi:MAG: hypothetical protein QF682_12950, partial [Candidatus Thermoplasmatota archaeon]|nr:hypothetical protein [Candidatus Thermoplasmatota archaeon]
VDQESTGASSGTVDLVEANNSASVFNDDLGIVEEYSAAAVVDPHGSFVNNNVLDQDSVVLLNISCDEIERSPLVAAAAFGANGGLAASSSGSVKFIISSGMTPTIKGFNVPGSFPANGGWVKFY